MRGITLELLVPGLVDALGRVAQGGGPRFPALQRLLGRADRVAAHSGDGGELLLSRFGMQREPDTDAPVAPLSLLGEGGDPGEHWWLRADPVHLRADQDRLLLMGAPLIQLTREHAEAFCRLLNEHFADQGLTFLCHHPTRWYLRLAEPPRIRTAPLAQVQGRNVHAHLPEGPDAGLWRGRLNEVQMLLHGAGPNQARAAGGAEAVNSLWFWGAGRRPAACTGGFDAVYGDSPLAAGLARCSGSATAPLPETAAAWLDSQPAGRQLITMDWVGAAALVGDGEGALRTFEHRWARPLWQALGRGRVAAITLWPGGAHGYRLHRTSPWRFWRRAWRPAP